MLHHVSLEVPPDQIERSIEFWAMLGFIRVDVPEVIAGYVTWVERDGTHIHLIATAEPTVPALGHPAVVAPGFDRTVDRLRAAGFQVEPARELWGAARAFATAPGGHRVELMAAPPATEGAGS